MGLIWPVLAAIAIWALVRLGRQTERAGTGHWRVAATFLAAVLLAGGVFALSRGAWIAGVSFAGAGLYLVLASRARAARQTPEPMSEAEARSLLGLEPGCSPEAVTAAWRRLIAMAHPDQGGTHGLASRLNAARDRLSKP